MRIPVRPAISVAIALLLTGCCGPRWQLHESTYSYAEEGGDDEGYVTKNTILLDTRSGKTWMLIPSDEDDVELWNWVEIPVQ